MPSSTSRSSSGHRTREGGSRRSRSNGRSRSRHREGRHSRSQSRFRFKHKERNFPAAICSMITIVILCVAMAEPKWFYLSGGGCSVGSAVGKDTRSQHYLGVGEFFYSGNLSMKSVGWLYQYGPASGEVFINCVDKKTVLLFKTVIAFCFITVMFSLIAFLLDLTGPSGRVLQRFHRNAIFSIITVTLCVVVNIFAYLISSEISALQTNTKQHKGSKIVVSFDISFYLIAAAGSMSVFAVACNCFRRYPMYEEPPYQMLDEDLESIIPDHDMAPMANLPPPPAYSPNPNHTPANQPSTASERLPTYLESVTSAPSLTSVPSPQPSGATQMLSVNA